MWAGTQGLYGAETGIQGFMLARLSLNQLNDNPKWEIMLFHPNPHLLVEYYENMKWNRI